MANEQDQHYRIIGAELARYIRERNEDVPASHVLQAIVADLAGHDEQLVLPLKTLVSKPGFLSLLPLAGSGTGEVQRYALVKDLQTTFSDATVANVSSVLDGFLNITRNTKKAVDNPDNDVTIPISFGTHTSQGGLVRHVIGATWRYKIALLLFLMAGSSAMFYFWGGRQLSSNNRESFISSAKIVNGRKVFYEYAESEDAVLCDERQSDRWQKASACRYMENHYKGRWIKFASHKDFCRFFRGQGGTIDDACKVGAPASEGYQYSGSVYCGDVIDPYQTPCFVLLGQSGSKKKSVFPSKQVYCANSLGDPICNKSYEPRPPRDIDI